MRIVCTTAASAEHVLAILMQAQMRPRQDFVVHSGTDLTPPIAFILLTMLPEVLFSQIHALPEIVIAREAGA